MQAQHRNTALLLAVLSIPFGVAVYQDATADKLDSKSQHDEYKIDQAAIDEALAEIEEYEAREAYEAPPTAMGASFFDEVFFDGGRARAPIMAGPIAGLEIGMEIDQVEQLYPEIWQWSYGGLPGHPGAHLSLSLEEEKLYQVEFSFLDDGSARRSITAQWGEPVAETDSSSRIWVNPEQRLRAQLNEGYGDYGMSTLVLGAYQSLEDFVAPSSLLFSFEDKNLFSLSKEEVRKLPGYTGSSAFLSVPPPLSSSDVRVAINVQIEDERVQSASVELQLSQAASRELLQHLEAKLGAPEKGGDRWVSEYTFQKGKRQVVLSTDNSGWHSLSLSPR